MEDLDLDMETEEEEEGPIREEQSRTLEEKYARAKVLRSKVARISKRKAQLRSNKVSPVKLLRWNMISKYSGLS